MLANAWVSLFLNNKKNNVTFKVKITTINFYFGVLHPVACITSRLLEVPSFPTTFQGVYSIFYIL
jgi:hypothetical protein